MQKCSGCKQNGKYICTNCGVIQCDNCAKENLYICARCKHVLVLLEESEMENFCREKVSIEKH